MHAGSWPRPKDKKIWPNAEQQAASGDRTAKRRKSATALTIPGPPLAVKPTNVRRNSTANVAVPMSGSPVLRTGRKLTPDEELLLVESAQEAMARYPGCPTTTLKKNPNKRMFGSANR